MSVTNSDTPAQLGKLNRRPGWIYLNVVFAMFLAMATLAACVDDGDDDVVDDDATTEEPAATDDAADDDAVVDDDGEPLKVVVSMPFMPSMVDAVGGDHIEIESIVPTGADAHTYQPTPGDAQLIADADIIFVNGLGLEEFLDGLIESAGGVDAPIFELADGLQDEGIESDGHHHDDDDDHGHDDDADDHGHEDDDHGHEDDDHGHEDDDHGHEDDDHGHEDDDHGHEDDDHGHEDDDHGHEDDHADDHGHDDDHADDHGHDDDHADDHGHDDDHADDHGHDDDHADDHGHDDDHADDHGHDDDHADDHGHEDDDHGHDDDADDHGHEDDDHGHDDDHDDHDHDYEYGNPHFWLSPVYGIHYVENIYEGLAEIDPANADDYRSNADDYIAEIEAFDEWAQEEMAQIPDENRFMVTFHDAFPYFAEHYDLEVVGVVVVSPGREPGAQELAQLADDIQEVGVPAVFIEPQFNPSLADAIADEAGVQTLMIYSDTPPEGAGYLEMMELNVEAVVEGLS